MDTLFYEETKELGFEYVQGSYYKEWTFKGGSLLADVRIVEKNIRKSTLYLTLLDHSEEVWENHYGVNENLTFVFMETKIKAQEILNNIKELEEILTGNEKESYNE